MESVVIMSSLPAMLKKALENAKQKSGGVRHRTRRRRCRNRRNRRNRARTRK